MVALEPGAIHTGFVLPLLFLLLIGVPILELYVIVQVAHVIGIVDTLALLIAESVLGAWLLKRQGVAAWRRLRLALQAGQVPTKEAADGAMIVLGGALLLTPGFVTDLFGFALLIPPSRAGLRGLFRKLSARWARRRLSGLERARRVHTVTARVYRRDAANGRADEESVDRRPSLEAGSPDKR